MIRRPPRSTLFPYTRSSDLELDAAATANPHPGRVPVHRLNRTEYINAIRDLLGVEIEDRKSTRLNSSHANISYAVFCLKKKKKKISREFKQKITKISR